MNEKDIILKLLAIATKQQKMIHKLAQDDTIRYQSAKERHSPGHIDPNLDYLKEAVTTAMGNAKIKLPFSVYVKSNPGTQAGNTAIGETYTVTISGIDKADNTAKQNLINSYNQLIKTQKPELDGKVSILFA